MKTRTALASCVAVLCVGALVAFAGSDGGESAGSLKIFTLCVAFAFVVNWLAFVPSFMNQTEHYFDLTGSLTYISVVAMALLLTDQLDTRTLICGLLVIVWAGRLGSFLFARVRAAGSDGRFDKLKTNFARFLMVWTLQGLWVTFTAAAALAAMTSGAKQSFGALGVLGVAVWVSGFAIEVVADIIALPALQGWQFVTLASPVFVFVLLTKISGLPMLERRADKRWGDRDDYQHYKANTPVLLLRRPKTAAIR